MSARRVACVVSCAAALWTAVIPIASAMGGVQGSPKIINPFLDWQLRDSDLPSLAKWDVVVLDADQQTANPQKIRQLRLLNPNIKILAYVPTEEISNARFAEAQNYPFGYLAAHIQDEWYVRDAAGNKSYFWPGSTLLDVTDRGPLPASGVRWNDYLPHFIHDQVLSTGLWDGVFLDNSFDAISYYSKLPVDLNRDGKPDTKDEQDTAWRAGMTKMFGKIRALNPSAILLGNGGQYYASQLNGAFFEHFPSYNWAINWKEFRTSVSRNPAPTYTALNVNTDNQYQPDAYAKMRYGLANALVGGGLFSFDEGDANHKTLWWYDEYSVPLGAAKSDPRALVGGKGNVVVPAVWSRDFQNGIAIFNSTDSTQRVPLPGVYEKIHGTQDPTTNDGTIVNTIRLASHDGILLLRHSSPQQIRGSAFENGAFMRIYNAKGQQPQNGFFAQRDDAPNGALVLTTDVNGDGSDDLVVSAKGAVSIKIGTKTSVFSPFGSRYTGPVSLAAGQLTRTGDQQIVTAREAGGPPEVKIFSSTGTLVRQWMAYNPAFSGGVRVAVGDLDGNGMREIVTGAGPGGGPHIRIWKTDGTVWGGSFFAFDPSEHGGVSVAVGDVDGDGKDEIVVGSGQGAVPRVRIFDFRGTLKREISLGTQPIANGIRVSVSDVNGDGIKEILVSGLPVF